MSQSGYTQQMAYRRVTAFAEGSHATRSGADQDVVPCRPGERAAPRPKL